MVHVPQSQEEAVQLQGKPRERKDMGVMSGDHEWQAIAAKEKRDREYIRLDRTWQKRSSHASDGGSPLSASSTTYTS